MLPYWLFLFPRTNRAAENPVVREDCVWNQNASQALTLLWTQALIKQNLKKNQQKGIYGFILGREIFGYHCQQISTNRG